MREGRKESARKSGKATCRMGKRGYDVERSSAIQWVRAAAVTYSVIHIAMNEQQFPDFEPCFEP